MEKKEPIKISLPMFITVIVLLIAIISGIYVFMQNQKLDKEITGLKEQISKTQTEKNELQDKLNNASNVVSNTEESNTDTNNSNDEKFIVPSLSTGTVKNAISNWKYDLEISDNLCMISLNSGIPYISWNTKIKDEKINSTLNDLSKWYNVTLTDESQKISGFNKKVVDVHIGGIGQDISGQVYIFQMEDGTIEYSTIENMIKNVSTQGKIGQLKNIVKIQDAVVDDDLSGFYTVVAIDKDNNCYDLDEYIDN
ncbi:MAG: hypothetical protein IKF83_01060 [Clostridia bacterium]|nr:hypothetical protein [Clostridia bacterium]